MGLHAMAVRWSFLEVLVRMVLSRSFAPITISDSVAPPMLARIARTHGAEDESEAIPRSVSGIQTHALLLTVLLLFPSGHDVEALRPLLKLAGLPCEAEGRKWGEEKV